MTGALLVIGICGLIGVGIYGLLILQHLIKLIIALQILTKAAALALVVAGAMTDQLALGQSLALTVIVADTLTAVVGLALAVQVRRQCGTLNVSALAALKK